MKYRFKLLQYLGKGLEQAGVPILKPISGRSVNLDARQFLPNIPQSEFPGWALTVAL